MLLADRGYDADWFRGALAKKGIVACIPSKVNRKTPIPHDKQLYRQRTAVERINSQAVALGIEYPHLRNGAAIANHNTLIYLLINLRFLQRLREGHAKDT